jgi:hypothetical protein
LNESGQAIFTTPDLDGLDDFIKGLGEQASVLTVQPGIVQ